MTLQSSGPISLGNVAVELGRTSTTTTSLGEAAVRTLAGVASGPISLSNLYGKSNESFWHVTFGSTVVSFLILGTDSSGNIYASATSAVFKWNRDGALIWARNVSGPFINGGWIDAAGNVTSLAPTTRATTLAGWPSSTPQEPSNGSAASTARARNSGTMRRSMHRATSMWRATRPRAAVLETPMR
ncbi:MAG: hypothetical protein IPP45_11110 [Sphingomonadales bacterium]|nr:hypothetical protein [Sphingomonadales bacterium]